MPDIHAIKVRKNNQVTEYDIVDNVARNGHFIGDVYVNSNIDYTGGNKLPDESRVNTLISDAIGQITKLTLELVQQLPQVGEANKIYLVPKDPDIDDIYNEYIYINDTWELIGNTDIDVSDKADKADTVLDTTLSINRLSDSNVGANSVALGNGVTASGSYSQAFGIYSSANGYASSAEGVSTIANGYGAHAEGISTSANGSEAHSEGSRTVASGDQSHAEGNNTVANHKSQHAFGEFNIADSSDAAATNRGTYVEIVGNGADTNNRSNARTLDWEGNEELAGDLTINKGTANEVSVSELYRKPATGIPASDLADNVIPDLSDKADKAGTILTTTLSRGRKSGTTIGTGSFAFGNNVEASGNYSTAMGTTSTSSGGGTTITTYLKATGVGSHAEGAGTVASGNNSHSEGRTTTASNDSSHAEGLDTKASGNASHAEGASTTASGANSHAEGMYSKSTANSSHAEGYYTSASGSYSHAEGNTTIANHKSQHTFGEYNVADSSSAVTTARGTYVEIVGNGTGSGNKSNARALDWDGNERLKGDIYVNCASDSTGGNKLPTESRVGELIATAIGGISSFDVSIVQELPQSGNNHTIYFVPKTGSTDDVYEEYMYINNNWELIGTTEIDISMKADKADTVLDTTLSRGRKADTTVGYGSFAFGDDVTASGLYSHAEGRLTVASNEASHAEGASTAATGYAAHAEGAGTTANYNTAHAEGLQAIASGQASHAEGYYTNADGNYSHAEGSSFHGNNDYKPYSYDFSTDTTSFTTINAKPGAIGASSHSEGSYTRASSNDAHAEGGYTYASGSQAHAEGRYTYATGDQAHSEGNNTTASGNQSHAEGNLTIASGLDSHAEGYSTVAYGDHSHAEGSTTRALAYYSHAEGDHSKAKGLNSHAEGDHTETNATSSHAEGSYSTVSGNFSHAEGLYGRVNSNGSGAHSEGYGSATNINYPQYNAQIDRTANFNGRTQPGTSINLPTGAHYQGAHNEGTYTTANAASSHAEGNSTLVTADDSHAEGLGSIVTGGPASHAEGKYTYVFSAGGAHAEGQYTIAQGGGGEHAEGMYTSSSGGGGTHAEGYVTSVSGGNGAHAEGYYVFGTGSYGFHIEGDHTECNVGNGAHTEGYYSKSYGREGSHTEGYYTIGGGEGSHTGGRYNIANNMNFLPEWEPNKLYHVGDKVKRTFINAGNEIYDVYTCNTEHISGSEFNSLNWTQGYSDNGYAEIIGNGTADNERANARALDWEGNEHLAGNLYVGCNPDSTGGTKVLTENDLEYTTEADALKIISDFWNEDEEDETMIVEMVTTANGYASVMDASEIGAAIESGKIVMLHIPAPDNNHPDAYIMLGYYAPALEGSENYANAAFAYVDTSPVDNYSYDLINQLNYPFVNDNGKLEIYYAT